MATISYGMALQQRHCMLVQNLFTSHHNLYSMSDMCNTVATTLSCQNSLFWLLMLPFAVEGSCTMRKMCTGHQWPRTNSINQIKYIWSMNQRTYLKSRYFINVCGPLFVFLFRPICIHKSILSLSPVFPITPVTLTRIKGTKMVISAIDYHEACL